MNTVYALLVYAATGMFSDTDSVALTTVQNIPTKQECEKYGRQAESMTDATKKNIKFVCIPTVK